MSNRYYLDVPDPHFPPVSKTIYDNQDGMPVITVEPQGGQWTQERQEILDAVMKALNPSSGDTTSTG